MAAIIYYSYRPKIISMLQIVHIHMLQFSTHKYASISIFISANFSWNVKILENI